MGSPGFAVPSLEQLVADKWNVVAVFTQPDRRAGRGRTLALPPVKETALSLGIPVEQPESLKNEEDFIRLAAYKPDLIVICAFGQILPLPVLELPPLQCVNIHFSLLPKHRGASPVASAILAGDEFTGVTIQLVRKKLDTGPILTRAAIPVAPQDNTGTLLEKLSIVGSRLLLEALTDWVRGEVVPRPQDDADSNYFARITKEAGNIEWDLPAIEIWRQVRAYNPWPGSFTKWRGKRLKIIEAVPIIGDLEKGRVAVLSNKEADIGVGTGDGILGLLKVQLQGKRVVSAAEFLCGQQEFVGSVLPDRIDIS